MQVFMHLPVATRILKKSKLGAEQIRASDAES